MAKCGDCIHADICKQVNGGWFSPENIAYCKGFKDRTKYVEVVRCKDCKHWIHIENGMGDCTNRRFHIDNHADPTMYSTDFCSCGERREA